MHPAPGSPRARARILASISPGTTRVALVEDERLAEIFIQGWDERALVGNVYKGRVSNVVPGIHAAFVDVGLTQDVFLSLTDVHPLVGAEAEPEPVARTAAVTLRPGDDIVVQIVKEPVGTKGPRATTQVSLAGRCLVLTPGCERVGVSRRIADIESRDRLRALIEPHLGPGLGFIVRTAALGHDDEEILTDASFLQGLWQTILARIERSGPYSLIYRDGDLLLKLLRDLGSFQVDEFLIDSRDEYERLIEAGEHLPGSLRERIRLYRGSVPLFEGQGIEEALRKALKKRVWLPSGGYLVIEETEALATIDVNTGRFLGNSSHEETAFQLNMEAVDVIAQQVRLRNLGGIIIVDFIDMLEPEHKLAVTRSLRDAFRDDRMKTHVLDVTDLGLVQMTRKRSRPSLAASAKVPCAHCRGEGRVPSPGLLCTEVHQEILKRSAGGRGGQILVTAGPGLASSLVEIMAEAFRVVELETGIKVFVRAEPSFEAQQFAIEGPSSGMNLDSPPKPC